MDNYLKEQENKTIRLVEERGVAAFPYKAVIKGIVDYCCRSCAGLKPGENREFTIPDSLTKKIAFVENLSIIVKVEDGTNFANSSGGGAINQKYSDQIINGKYSEATIEIEGYSYYGVLYERTIYNSLCHELNHLYEAWKELLRTNSMWLYASKNCKANPHITCFSSQELNRFLNQMIYRLFSESEMNAIIAGVYGDLAGFKSVRSNFHQDIKRTQAYKIYAAITDQLDVLRDTLIEEKENVIRFVHQLRLFGIELNPYTKDADGYIKEFLRKTKFLLNCLIRGIGRTPSPSYDSVETPEPKENIKLK